LTGVARDLLEQGNRMSYLFTSESVTAGHPDKVADQIPLTPRGIIEHLKLRNPIYQSTAAYGHFGREPKDGQFSWEVVDKVSQLSGFISGHPHRVHA